MYRSWEHFGYHCEWEIGSAVIPLLCFLISKKMRQLRVGCNPRLDLKLISTDNDHIRLNSYEII